MKRFVSFAAAAVTATVLLSSSAATAGDIQVQNPWARASAGMAKAGAAFMEIKNGGAADRLVAAKADVAETVELHTHIQEGEVMKMRRVEAIDVPASGMVHLKPGGFHVMLMGLEAPLREGETFPLTLTFEKGGAMTVDVKIEKAGAMGPMHKGMHGHGDDTMKTKPKTQ